MSSDQRSRLAAEMSDFAAAEADARQAITQAPQIGSYLAWLGDVYLKEGCLDEALGQAGAPADARAAYRRALELDPANPGASNGPAALQPR